MNTRIFLTLVVLNAVFFNACKKSNDCPASTNVTVSANANSLTQGWDLQLSANYSSLNTYQWQGPNGWNVQTSSAVVTRVNMQFQDAGTYSVKVFNFNNCLVYEGSQVIVVTPVQSAPCETTNTNNLCTSDIPGLTSFALNAVYFGGNPSGNINVTGYSNANTQGGSSVVFNFSTSSRPRPGLYKTVYGYRATGKDDELSINLYSSVTNEWYIAEQGYPVYVTLVNGKTQICICNIPLRISFFGTPNYVSGKMTASN